MNIFEMFENLSALEWFGQICGLFGFAFIMISFQLSRRRYYFVAGIAMVLFIIESCCNTTARANIMPLVVSFIRNFWMYILVVKNKGELKKSYLYGLLLLLWVGQAAYIIISKTWSSFTVYLPIVLTTILTILQNNKNYYVVKAGNFINEFGYLIFYIVSGLPFSIFRQIILSISILISVIRMIIKDRRNKISKKTAL